MNELERITKERDAWIETARQFAKDLDFYRGLLKECAEHIGLDAYRCDDGSISKDPLFSKIPEILERKYEDD